MSTASQSFALRQGDVLVRTAEIPADATPIPPRPLALGEKTGHHHSLMVDEPETAIEDAVEMYEKDGQIYVRIKDESAVSLVHQEHKAHKVPPGDYAIIIQQEETDWGTRQVAD